MNKKRIMAVLLAVVMFFTGAMFSPSAAQADETQNQSSEIIYDNAYKMSDYWSTTAKKSPIKSGYVFGGWFLEENGKYIAINETDIDSAVDTAYAKFVPAYVLSVKTQYESDLLASDSDTTFRAITTTDSLDYQNMGFDIWYNNKIQHKNFDELKTEKVLSKLKINDTKSITPQEAFGSDSHYFAAVKITNVIQVNFNKVIYVRPYWTTLDGTKVEGCAKYIHMEDGFSDYDYYSVPVNLQGGQEIAAGIVTMKYDNDTLEPISTGKTVEAGRILKELTYYVDETKGIVTFAANSEKTTDTDTSDNIMANIRFRVKDGKEAASSYEFDMEVNSFANWDEEYVNVHAVDYTY